MWPARRRPWSSRMAAGCASADRGNIGSRVTAGGSAVSGHGGRRLGRLPHGRVLDPMAERLGVDVFSAPHRRHYDRTAHELRCDSPRTIVRRHRQRLGRRCRVLQTGRRVLRVRQLVGLGLRGVRYRTQCDPVLPRVRDLYDSRYAISAPEAHPCTSSHRPTGARRGQTAARHRMHDCVRQVMQDFVTSQPGRTAYVDVQSLLVPRRRLQRHRRGRAGAPTVTCLLGPGGRPSSARSSATRSSHPDRGWPAVSIDCCTAS